MLLHTLLVRLSIVCVCSGLRLVDILIKAPSIEREQSGVFLLYPSSETKNTESPRSANSNLSADLLS